MAAVIPSRRRRVTGTAEQLRAELERSHAAGELASLTPPTSADGRTFTTYVEVRTAPAPAAAAVAWRRPAVITLAVVAGLALVGWAGYALVMWVRAHAETLIGFGCMAVVVACLVGRFALRACAGIIAHCTGCRD